MILTKEPVITLISVSASSADIRYSYLLCMKQDKKLLFIKNNSMVVGIFSAFNFFIY